MQAAAYVDGVKMDRTANLTPGVHHVRVEAMLTGDRWRFEPRWNGADLWRSRGRGGDGEAAVAVRRDRPSVGGLARHRARRRTLDRVDRLAPRADRFAGCARVDRGCVSGARRPRGHQSRRGGAVVCGRI